MILTCAGALFLISKLILFFISMLEIILINPPKKANSEVDVGDRIRM